jgi:hypothetical protein
MLTRSVRESKGFALFVVCVAVFTDVFVYGLVVPVMPFALTQRMGVPEEDVQKWNSVLLGILGGAIIIGGSTSKQQLLSNHKKKRKGRLQKGDVC